MDRNLKVFKRFLSMSKFVMVMIFLSIILFTILLSACSPESQLFPRGINFENNQQTADFDIVDEDLETQIDPEKLPSREPIPCPGLDSQLYQMTQSENPLSMASQMGLKTKDKKVQVLFVLNNEASDFLLDYNVELGTQSGNQVQGYAPIDRLCEIAMIEKVLVIRPVDRIY
jgi:hypothetical protein